MVGQMGLLAIINFFLVLLRNNFGGLDYVIRAPRLLQY